MMGCLRRSVALHVVFPRCQKGECCTSVHCIIFLSQSWLVKVPVYADYAYRRAPLTNTTGIMAERHHILVAPHIRGNVT